ncbi:testis anion transporter 1 [Nyctibius grandis]|uniref:testis anion transporter 1 n=1 Tax=Nyctibius grandis TaxID=48427 RepID=UPI0035BC576E
MARGGRAPGTQHLTESKEKCRLRSISRHTLKETYLPPWVEHYKSLERTDSYSAGSFSILNVAVTNVLKTLNFNQTLSSNGSLDNFSDPTFMKGYMEALTLTASITFLTAIIQLLLGCCCLGFVTTYVPKTLIDASLTAAPLHVTVSQFTFIFDIKLAFCKGPLENSYVVWFVTLAAVLCFGLGVGSAIAVGFTFFLITIRSHRMKMVVLGQIPTMNIYRSLSIYKAMDMKAVPLDESEMRALISLTLSDTAVGGRDLKCSCACNPPLPPPRNSLTQGY